MSYQLIVRKDAEHDIAEAYVWYEDKRGGLGDEFVFCLDACVSALIRNPFIYQKKYFEIRVGLIDRFPFATYYLVKENKIIIIAILHLSRNPKFWQKRK